MRVVPVDDTNQNAFYALQRNSNEIYSSSSWQLAYPNGLKKWLILNDNDVAIGGFVLYEKIRFGLRMWITPPFASHCGLFIVNEKSTPSSRLTHLKKVATAIADFLKNAQVHYFKMELPAEFRDAQPFIWRKLKVDIRYTYVLDLSREWEVILQAMDTNLRNKWSKFDAAKWSISSEKNVESAYRLFTNALIRNKAKWNPEIVRGLMKLSEMHHIHVLENNASIATALFAGQGNKCYYLFGAANRQAGTAVGPIAIIAAMQKAKEVGFEYFDLEGSMIPEVEAYFRQFGGDHQTMFTIKGGRGLWPRLFNWYFGN